MIELTQRTVQLINNLFVKADRQEASKLLKFECADNIAFNNGNNSIGMERIRFAAIKLSQGNLAKLYYAVDLAQKDWRDLLLFSDCALDLNSHEIWANNVLDNE